MTTPRNDDTLSARAADAASALRQAAGQAGDTFERAMTEGEWLDRIPGRSVTLAGLGLVVVAIALSLLPSFHGIGPAWSAVMLAGGALVGVRELRSAGVPLAGVRVPESALHPLLPPAFAALVALHAFQLFRVGIVPLLWLGAAVLLGWDQYRKAVLSPGFAARFDLRQTWRGYRRNVVLGATVCLGAMFMTWGQSSGYWTGGYSYNYGYRYNSAAGGYESGYAYDYQPMQYYWPGWETSGRNQSFAIFAVAALLALVLWAAYRRNGSTEGRFRHVALGLGAFLAVFWMMAARDGPGSLVFLLGLSAVLFAAFRITRGEDEGRWDAAHLWARIRRRPSPDAPA